MKKVFVFCLYCMIFTLVSAVSGFAQLSIDSYLSDDLLFSSHGGGGVSYDDDDDDEIDIFIYEEDIFEERVIVEEFSPPPPPVEQVPEVLAYSTQDTFVPEPTPAPPPAPVTPTPPPSPIVTSTPPPSPSAIPAPAPQPPAQQVPPPATAQPQGPPQPPVRTVVPMTVFIMPPAAPSSNKVPIKVVPGMPDPRSKSIYRVQLGAFANMDLARQCYNRLQAAGFSPLYEQYGNLNRVIIVGIKAVDMARVIQRLDAAGFSDAWIREEK